MQIKVFVKYLFILSVIVCFAFGEKAHGFSFCGKNADCSLSFDEFIMCKKELIATDSKTSINSFVVTIQKIEKKETYSVQYKSKGKMFSKTLIEAIEKLHKDKKLGNIVLIEDVEIIQSGQAAKKDSGFKITLI
ncbi:MAG: hypothetical protein JNL69_06305 [Bacteroidia bacterium]|nr:hypothetical protein [Bacteroidia bacterium]